jgi:hypothetical protein
MSCLQFRRVPHKRLHVTLSLLNQVKVYLLKNPLTSKLKLVTKKEKTGRTTTENFCLLFFQTKNTHSKPKNKPSKNKEEEKTNTPTIKIFSSTQKIEFGWVNLSQPQCEARIKF